MQHQTRGAGCRGPNPRRAYNTGSERRTFCTSVKLQFKFREATPSPAREALLTELCDHGAAKVRRLSPQEEDVELAALHVVEIEGDGAASRLIELLERSLAVEFAESESPRRAL